MSYSKESKNYVIGAISGIIPLALTLPIDYVKVQVQVLAEGHRKFRSHPLALTQEVFKSKGLLEFYKGLSGAVCRQLILATIRLGLYKTLHDREAEKSPDKTVTFSMKILLSFFCGGLGSWIATPFDLTLVRLQSDRLLPESQRRNYKGTLDALHRIPREEGILNCWKGSIPVVLRVAIVNSISLVGYDYIKKYLDEMYGFAAIHRIYASFISSVLGCAASMPVDNFKTKFQKMAKGPNGLYPYSSFRDCVVKSIQREGFSGLYVGFFIYVIRIGPHAILSMLIQDFLHHIT